MVRVRSAVSVVWLTIQLLLPMHYYVFRQTEDFANEVYAWRMFSSVQHSEGFVEWFSHSLSTGDNGIFINFKKMGVSKEYASYVTGIRTRGRRGKIPPLWIMDRFSGFLCKNKNITAVGARVTYDSWEGDSVDKEYTWKC